MVLGLGFWGGSQGVREMWVCDGVGKWWVGKGNRGWTAVGFVVANWFADSLALSSANASQNALWFMKLSFL